jgi:hypothetical protein
MGQGGSELLGSYSSVPSAASSNYSAGLGVTSRHVIRYRRYAREPSGLTLACGPAAQATSFC